MPNLTPLIAQLQQDYPELNFSLAERDTFHPPVTIFYAKATPPLVLLHEIGHYLIRRTDFSSDIELIQIESLAWQQAKLLAPKYQIKWNEDLAQDCLDSYRDYLHQASLCPNCAITGYQDNAGHYHCPLCNTTWNSPGRPED